MKSFPLATVVKTGLLVGLFDITAAFIQYYINTQKNPLNVAKYIAGGIFGKEAFTGSDMMIVWGLLFHFCIATSFAIFFFWLASQLPGILQYRILTGILYGIFIWCVMQFIVLPLSKLPPGTIKPSKAIIAILILIVCIGIPLAFIAKKKIRLS